MVCNVGVDNQGNPIDANGRLIVEKIKTLAEIADNEFIRGTRNVLLPSLPQKLDKAIGANGKGVIIKKVIFDKNRKAHKELKISDNQIILQFSLYSTHLYGKNQAKQRPYNWSLISILSDRITKIVVEVDVNKMFCEIIGWHYLKNNTLQKLKRQAAKEGGQILKLSTENPSANNLNNLPF